MSVPSSKPLPAEHPFSQETVQVFQSLGLSEQAATGAAKAGFVEPTEIQKRAISVVASGRDITASSETGSGKTASFVLPVLDLLDYQSPEIQVLVLVPTRELCHQVGEAFKLLGRDTPLKTAEIYGGVRYDKQRNMLKQNPQVVVGTPGRVLDLLSSRQISFKRVKILILDEGDRMLDMGFLPQMKDILEYVPRKRQTMMFSATMQSKLTRFASGCLKDPEYIQVGERAKPPVQVEQDAIKLLLAEKVPKLIEVVEQEQGTILVFTATKSCANQIYNALKRKGQKACVIHSDLSQGARQEALEGFMSGKYRIMAATDIAQRGLDIEGISLVINFDLPNNPEDYVHRIGRTGRANAPGRAVSFVTLREYSMIKAIERATGQTFKDFKPAERSLGRRRGLKRRVS